ncbi:MAG: hypothetical protein HZA21_01505 [Nitrospirae bacterium]|nr:hypothetical protein [Nitrospirota bacterium]
MTKKLLMTALAVVAALGLGLCPVWADEGYGHGKRDGSHGCCEGHGYGMQGHHSSAGHLLRHLLGAQKEMGLTDEQVAKLKALQLDLDKTRIKAEADIMVAEREVQALVENEKTELSAIEEKIKQSELLEVGLRMTAIKARRDAMAVLTPEQSQRVKALHEAMMQRYKEGRKEGHKEGGMMKGDGHPKGKPKKSDEKKEPTH